MILALSHINFYLCSPTFLTFYESIDITINVYDLSGAVRLSILTSLSYVTCVNLVWSYKTQLVKFCVEKRNWFIKQEIRELSDRSGAFH